MSATVISKAQGPSMPFYAKRLAPLAVFIFALLLRIAHNVFFVEHRFLFFGDSYNYLQSGACLLNVIGTSHSIADFIHTIWQPESASYSALLAQSASNLNGRLMIDGPIYPSYLALCQWLSGVQAARPVFEQAFAGISLCNCVLDSFTCVLLYFCGRLAFNRPVGLIAALLLAIYPAAIINTANCYSEQFAYFQVTVLLLITLTLNLRHGLSARRRVMLWAALGASFSFLMLCRPAFMLLPPVVALTVCIFSLGHGLWATANTDKGKSQPLLSIVLNLSIAAIVAFLVVLPWGLFSQAKTGKFVLFVNRVPGINLYLGNNIYEDGWRAYPHPGFMPQDVKGAISMLAHDASIHPAAMVMLEVRKVARLFAWAWNDHDERVFGISAFGQNLLHQLIVSFGSLGLVVGLTGPERRRPSLSRSYRACVLLLAIILFHFSYVAFESISRYAITAMPAFILLAAYSLHKAAGHKKILIGSAAAFTVVFSLMAARSYLSETISAFLPVAMTPLGPWLSGFLLVGFIWLVYPFAQKLCQICAGSFSLTSKNILLALFVFLSLLTLICAVDAPDKTEWRVKLGSPEQILEQQIKLPATISGATAGAAGAVDNFADSGIVVMDMSASSLPSALIVCVNGHVSDESAVPLAQLQNFDIGIIKSLSSEGTDRDKDFRSFRQWWAVPFPKKWLSENGLNKISIKSRGAENIYFYGDFKGARSTLVASGEQMLPSFRSFSATGGFFSCEAKDPRVMEPVRTLAESINSRYFDGKTWHETDLSSAAGCQSGVYRIRLALLPGGFRRQNVLSKKELPEKDAPEKVLPGDNAKKAKVDEVTVYGAAEQAISGNDPRSLVPPGSPFVIGPHPASRVQFSCELKGVASKTASFGLYFTGTLRGKSLHWASLWQPTCVAVGPEWRHFSFQDTLPQELAACDDLQFSILLAPCQTDLLYVQPKKAHRCMVLIRQARLRILPALPLPAPNSPSPNAPADPLTWTIF